MLDHDRAAGPIGSLKQRFFDRPRPTVAHASPAATAVERWGWAALDGAADVSRNGAARLSAWHHPAQAGRASQTARDPDFGRSDCAGSVNLWLRHAAAGSLKTVFSSRS